MHIPAAAPAGDPLAADESDTSAALAVDRPHVEIAPRAAHEDYDAHASAGAAPTDGAFGGNLQKLRALWVKFHNPVLIWSVGASFTVFFLTAVQGVLLARLLGPTMRGEYGTAIFYTQLLTFLGLLGTQLSIARRAAQGLNTFADLSRAALWVGCITGLGTMAVVCVLSFIALPAGKRELAPLCILGALYLPLEHVRLSLMAVDHGAGRLIRYSTHRLLAAIILPAMLLVVWMTGYVSLGFLVLLSVVAPLLALVVRLVGEPRDFWHASHSPAEKRVTPFKLIKEGVPYAVAQAASDVLNRLDVLLILWLAPFYIQGLYAAAVPAVSLLSAGPHAMALFSFNAGAKQHGSLKFRKLAGMAGAVSGFQLLTALAFAVVLPPLLIFFYGQDFTEAVPFAYALLPVFALNGCTVVAEGYLQGRGRTSVGIWCRLGGALVMMIFVAATFHAWGPLSIPLGAVAGQSFNALCMLWALSREAEVRLGGSHPKVASGVNA